jgi:hypothetical protein
MASEVITANISQYDLSVLAVSARMYDASAAELAKYAYRLFLGDTPEEARKVALIGRKSVTDNPTETEVQVFVRLPSDWVKEVQEKAPTFKNKSSFHRYVLALAAGKDEEQARAEATRPIGWTKGNPRKVTSS